MAETDMKPLSELDLYNENLDENSLLPMTVRPSGSNITRKVYFNALKEQIIGYEIVGTLTAGSTSITLSSTSTAYDDNANSHPVGERVSVSSKNYICIAACSKANWDTNQVYYVEYNLLDSNSTVEIYTTVYGVNPSDVTVADNAITLTFPAQSSDIGVKVRVFS